MRSIACNQCVIIVLLTLANYATVCHAQTLSWSGYEWRVRDSRGAAQGPGPNLFSNSKQNVWVDEQDNLHLAIRQNEAQQWTCAEVNLVKPLGYGTYEFEVSSRYDTLPDNIVVGLFTYLAPERVARQTKGIVGNKLPDTPHEIDIEFTGAWGPANLFFTTHDPDVDSPSFQFRTKLNGDYSTHRFDWKPERIVWESFHGHTALQNTPAHPMLDLGGKTLPASAPVRAEYAGPVIPSELDESVSLNFWLFGNDNANTGPSDGQPHEFIIHSFHFTPAE